MRVYDLATEAEVAQFQAADDTVNGCEFHPFLPLLATASGAPCTQGRRPVQRPAMLNCCGRRHRYALLAAQAAASKAGHSGTPGCLTQHASSKP